MGMLQGGNTVSNMVMGGMGVLDAQDTFHKAVTGTDQALGVVDQTVGVAGKIKDQVEQENAVFAIIKANNERIKAEEKAQK
jgi:hypothetical protein